MAVLMGLFPDFRPPFKIISLVVIWGYWAVASVGVWRSSNDAKNYIAFWRYSARAVILLYAFIFVRNFVQTSSVH
ncbi:hypothetical protein UP10_02050 [Bradyrhizobium sp. LTSPM299]|nr:hypothetical protein UP10_02050 [Bradyrhizobium sp. LTSPM299]